MTVVVGYVHPGHVSHHFLSSLLDTLRLHPDLGVIDERSGPNVASARNRVVDRFLATGRDWLLMADTDMAWQSDALDRLLAVADEQACPIVGGLCFGTSEGRLVPTIFANVTVRGVPALCRVEQYRRGRIVSCDATGSAFLLVHRGVFEAMQAQRFSVAFPWFQEVEANGMPQGEDITFCLRARELGYPVLVDTSVRTGHYKSGLLTEATYDAQEGT